MYARAVGVQYRVLGVNHDRGSADKVQRAQLINV